MSFPTPDETLIPVGLGPFVRPFVVTAEARGQAALVMLGDQAQHSAGFEVYPVATGARQDREPLILRGSKGQRLNIPTGEWEVQRVDSIVECGCALVFGASTVHPDRTSDTMVDAGSAKRGGVHATRALAYAYGLEDAPLRVNNTPERQHTRGSDPGTYPTTFNATLMTTQSRRSYQTATLDGIWVDDALAVTHFIKPEDLRPRWSTWVRLFDADDDRLFTWCDVTCLTERQRYDSQTEGTAHSEATGSYSGTLDLNSSGGFTDPAGSKDGSFSGTISGASEGSLALDTDTSYQHVSLGHLHYPVVLIGRGKDDGSPPAPNAGRIVPHNGTARLYGVHSFDPYYSGSTQHANERRNIWARVWYNPPALDPETPLLIISADAVWLAPPP